MANETAKFGNKTHTQVLPTHLDIPIKEQFGFFPTSIIKPTNESKKKWKEVAYFDDGKIDVRKTSSGNDVSGVQKMSEFHAGLCENIVKYWSMNGSKIVDPFAGRVTRATVSSILGREYYGYEITPNTYKRALEHFKKHNINPTLYNGDGTLLNETPNEFADLVMTCPPYFNIEKYESCDRQLSDINDYSKFMEMMNTTIENCFRVLKPGAFCVWVVADFRKNMQLIPFQSDLTQMFMKNGFINYDLVVMENISPWASMAIAQAAYKRYTFKVHEYIMVFKKPGEYEVPDYCTMDKPELNHIQTFFSF